MFVYKLKMINLSLYLTLSFSLFPIFFISCIFYILLSSFSPSSSMFSFLPSILCFFPFLLFLFLQYSCSHSFVILHHFHSLSQFQPTLSLSSSSSSFTFTPTIISPHLHCYSYHLSTTLSAPSLTLCQPHHYHSHHHHHHSLSCLVWSPVIASLLFLFLFQRCISLSVLFFLLVYCRQVSFVYIFFLPGIIIFLMFHLFIYFFGACFFHFGFSFPGMV